jgi:hypothetical protein
MNGHDTHQLPAVPAMTASRVLAMLQQNDWKLHHGNRVADRSPRRPRAYPLAGSHENDRTIKDERLQADRRGRVPAACASNDHLSTARLANWFLALRGKSLGQAAPGSPKRRCSSGKRVVAKGGNWRYGSRVAVSPAADLGRSSNLAHKRPTRLLALFLCLHHRVMAAVRGTPSGVPGAKFPVGQPAHSCHPNSLGREKWQLQTKLGAPPMNHPNALNPSTSHAAAWKARALAALRGNHSLSVRLRRYNQAMARARALEVQEVAHV